MATEITPEDLIALSEKLAALDLTPGEAVILHTALQAASGAEVTGFDLQQPPPDPTPKLYSSMLIQGIQPAIPRLGGKWIELSN